MGVVLRVHPVRDESHIKRNANQKVATPGKLSKVEIVRVAIVLGGICPAGNCPNWQFF